MSNMHDCLEVMINAGELPADVARKAQVAYGKLLDRYATIMSQGEAAAKAAADIKEATAKAQRARFHKVVNQLQAMRRIEAQVKAAPDPSKVLLGFFRYGEGQGATGESMQSLIEAHEDLIRAKMSEVLNSVGLNVFGTSRDPVLLGDMVRELHGQATGSAGAKVLAQAVAETEAMLVRAFNAQGGDIKILKDRGMPQSHDAGELLRRGFDEWAALIETRLAWHRIDDLSTGQPFAAGPGQVPPRSVTGAFLQDVYDSITTGGWDRREPSMAMGGTALYNQRAEHRVLHFKDGTAQLEYNKAFGGADPFTAIMNNLNGLARDVSMMRVLGPNPKMGLEYAGQVALKRAADLGNPKIADKVKRTIKRARVMLALTDGTANVPEHVGMARFFAGVRAVLTSVQLGSAILSSTSDVATITTAAQTMGMRGTNVLARSVKLMASHATRETAARMGYVAETLADAGGGAARYTGKIFGSGLPDRLAGFTLRASGLSFVTDMRKLAFQLEFSGHMADNAARDFAGIDAPLRAMFEARGITAADWDLLRDPATHFVAPNGANFISPIWWLEHQTTLPRAEAMGLALRLQMAMREQLEFAVPTASIEGRALMQGGSAPGTIYGELLRSSFAYKSFSLSLSINQFRRFMNQPGPMRKGIYAAKFTAFMAITGAITIQIKELAKGNDPRPMNTFAFWLAAIMQGGGLGIFGDFFNASTSRTGGSLAGTVLGPVVGAMGDFAMPIGSNIKALIEGKDTRVGADAAGLLRKYTPVASSMWYLRAAYSRLVADELQAFIDPQADVAMRRKVRQMQKDYGTQSFLPQRGGSSDFRMPNFANALGGSQ